LAARTGFTEGRILIVAFDGWNDAAEAASIAVKTVRDRLELVERAEVVDAEDYVDYQFNRPTVGIDEHGVKRIEWPSVTLYGPPAASTPTPRRFGRGKGLAADAELSVHEDGSHLWAMLGTEPSRSWRRFSAEVLQSVQSARITGIVFVGAMLADVPHTRPISVFTTSENVAVREQLSIERSSYEGPTGILGILADAAETAGIPTVSIWASVPHYVHNAPSPKATLALIDRLEEVLDVVIPRGDLLDESETWERGIDALAGEDDDMSAYIEQLEQARDTVDSPDASGEAIAREFERFLRKGDDGVAGSEGSTPEDPKTP